MQNGTTDTAITISLSGLQSRPRGRGDGLMEPAGGGAPLENTSLLLWTGLILVFLKRAVRVLLASCQL